MYNVKYLYMSISIVVLNNVAIYIQQSVSLTLLRLLNKKLYHYLIKLIIKLL